MPSRTYRRLPRLDLPLETYYVTACCLNRTPWFASADLAALLWQIILRQREHHVLLHAAVVMPDHYHLLMRLTGEARVPKVMRVIQSLSSHLLNQQVARSGPVWQPRFYDHVIRSEVDLREKFNYIHDNPCRRQLVAAPADYPYSSARFWLLDDASHGRFDAWH